MAVGEILKRKKTTAADLPEEVLRLEILTRLPIKSAVRFKCVSKSWLSLFSNPQFAKEHLTHNATENPNDYDCLVADSDRKIAILSRYKETFALPYDSIGLVGSVGGLVCLSHDIKLSLWNPAIHQSKEFTLPPNRLRDHLKFKGFGFDRNAMERAELKMRVEELEAEVAELKNIIELLRIVIKNNESKIALLEKHKEERTALLHTAIEIMGGSKKGEGK